MNQLARVAPQQSAALASPSSLGDLQVLGGVLARSGFFTDARDAAQAMVKVMAGAELGFGPIASMTGIYVVKGRITLSANLIAAAIKRSGKYDFRVREISPERCEIEFFQGSESIGTSIATMAEAKAGKWDMDWDRDSKSWKPKQTWQSFPKNMLYARALSNGAKWFVSDVFGGPIYEPDEMGLQIDAEGEVVTTREEQQPRQQPPRLQVVPTATPAATIEAEPLADREQAAAIYMLWPEFGVRANGVTKPLAEFLASKWQVSRAEDLSAANAQKLIEWMQQRQLAAQHPEPPKAAPGAGLDTWKCTQESGGRALAMEILSLTAEVETLGIAEAGWRDELKLEFPGVDSRKELTAEQAEAWREILRNLVVALKAKAAAATE